MEFYGVPVEIWVALIGLLGVVLAKRQYDVTQFREDLAEKDRAIEQERQEQERVANKEFRRLVIGPLVNMQKLEKISFRVRMLIQQTEISRVLILVAVNGSESATHATCIWDKRDPEEEWKYIDVPIDQDYRDRLSEAHRNGFASLETARVAGTKIGSIYEAEGIKHSVWTYIGRRAAIRTKQVATCFCSWSTNEDTPITPETLHKIMNISASIREMMVEAGYSS